MILLVFADQISKYLIVQTLTLGETINVLPFLDFYLIFNTGIAFSFFDEGGELGRWILVFFGFACLPIFSQCSYFRKTQEI